MEIVDTNDSLTHLLGEGATTELLEELGHTVHPVPIPPAGLAAWGFEGEPVEGVTALVAEGGLRILEARGLDPKTRRRMAIAVARRNPVVTTLWVWVDETEITFAHVGRGADGRPFVRSMEISRQHPDPVGLDQVRALSTSRIVAVDSDDAARYRAHYEEVLDHEGLTREFFGRFREALDELVGSIRNGPTAPRERHDVALVTLLRVVFLYFLQRKGILDGDPRYLSRRLHGSLQDGESFHDGLLRPLFFGVLNTPDEERDAQAKALGAIPFLNGGLFEPTPVERAWPDVGWSNATWAALLHGFFDRFHFTATEPEGCDEARVVDPEMLGRVFEGLMYGDDRRKSGAFYTPRDVVRQIVERAVTTRLGAMVDRDDLAPYEVPTDPGIRRALSDALAKITILDPAVGTGAFVLEALTVLRRWREELGGRVDWASTRAILHRNLFGVDANPTAIRLCELRLWLALLGSLQPGDAVEPLPNLSHRVVAGDSLVEPGDVVARTVAGTTVVSAETAVRIRSAERDHAFLEDRYLVAHGAEKLIVRASLDTARKQLQREVLEGRRRMLLDRREALRPALESEGLFGECRPDPECRRAAAGIEAALGELDEAMTSLDDDRRASGFAWAGTFGEVARRGFDVVVTNPPWIRAHRVGRESRRLHTARYRSASNELWKGARELGIRAPFGTQSDLSALFVERSLELLAPGGVLAALVPAKLFRSLHGASLRRVLAEHRIDAWEDLSDADRSLFEATTYPAILHVRRERPSSSPTQVRLWRGTGCREFRVSSDALPAGRTPGAPWFVAPPEVMDALEAVGETVPLGAVTGFAPRRGIFTGANDLFLRPAGGFEDELGPEVRPFVRRVVSGSSLGEGEALEILWCYDASGRPLPDVPAVLRNYFGEHLARLESRSDHDAALPPWQVFRVRPELLGPKVVWRDMGPHLEATVLEGDEVPLNTVYCIPCAEPRAAHNLAQWLNSSAARAFAYALGERARGGWRRHFSWLLRMLPIPIAAARSGFREGARAPLSADQERTLEKFMLGPRLNSPIAGGAK